MINNIIEQYLMKIPTEIKEADPTNKAETVIFKYFVIRGRGEWVRAEKNQY